MVIIFHNITVFRSKKFLSEEISFKNTEKSYQPQTFENERKCITEI